MRIKSKDIAEALNISPATVSLALNDKPGVNAETKKRVLDYVEVLEKQQQNEIQTKNVPNKGSILMLNYIKHGAILERNISKGNPAFELEKERVISRAGYHALYITFHEMTDNLESLLDICREKQVKGIYMMAAEMAQSDIYPFLQMKIPIVLGDNLFEEQRLDSFLIDNREGIRRGVDYLVDRGHSHIVYLAESITIFNFVERREAFIMEMKKRECGDAGNRIRYMGNNIDQVYQSMSKYLDKGIRQTTAFILESDVVSLGVSKALLERHIRIPRDISLVGFDALEPSHLMGINLTLIKGTHTKRHLNAIKHLLRRVEDDDDETVIIYYKTKMLEGESVFDKTKYIYIV